MGKNMRDSERKRSEKMRERWGSENERMREWEEEEGDREETKLGEHFLMNLS